MKNKLLQLQGEAGILMDNPLCSKGIDPAAYRADEKRCMDDEGSDSGEDPGGEQRSLIECTLLLHNDIFAFLLLSFELYHFSLPTCDLEAVTNTVRTCVAKSLCTDILYQDDPMLREHPLKL